MRITSFLKAWLNKIGMMYVQFKCKREFQAQQLLEINERPIELAFVFKQLAATWPKKILDVGTGTTALPHLMRGCGACVTATDNIRDYWPDGMINRHYHVVNDDITATTIRDTFDFITCVSVLEHIENHEAAVRNMFSLLSPGGRLVLTFPYNENASVENVYDLAESDVQRKMPFKTRAFSRAQVSAWLAQSQGQILDQEYWRFFAGEYWTCGPRVCPPMRVARHEPHQISCLLLAKA